MRNFMNKNRYNTVYRMVKDNFFDNGHIKIKIYNSIVAIFFWALAILPFVFIIRDLFIYYNITLLRTMEFELKFFGIWELFFLITVPLMIICTNQRIRKIYHRKRTFNPVRVKKRKRWLHRYYIDKFGVNLHNINNYIVDKNNNIPVDYIERTYRKQLKRKKERR